MICKSCSFENKEGAAFCAKCGAPLSQPEEKTSAADMKPVEDDSEANTTVLTSDMISPAKPQAPQQGNPAPQGFVPGPTGAPGAPMGGPKPMGGAPVGGSKPMGGAPMGGPKPMNGAPMGGPKPMGGAPMGAPGAPAPQKPANNAPKAPQPAKSGKTGTAAKVYIIVSIVLIVAMAGAGVWLFLHFNSKIDDISKEKDSLASQMDASSSNYENQISDKDSEIADLESQVTDYESQLSDYEDQISSYEETSASYSAYDSLIQFANSSVGQGYSDFFASDTVLHLSGGDVAVMVYFGVQEDSNVVYTVADSSVASCEWGDSWNGDVATLYVTPNGSGNTVITLSNDVNDETINIFVYVD